MSPENIIVVILLAWVLAMVIVLVVKRPGLPEIADKTDRIEERFASE